jgi:hypothetical protein
MGTRRPASDRQKRQASRRRRLARGTLVPRDRAREVDAVSDVDRRREAQSGPGAPGVWPPPTAPAATPADPESQGGADRGDLGPR